MDVFDSQGLSSKIAAAIALGATSHLLYFIRGEHHMQVHRILSLFLSLYSLLALEEYYMATGEQLQAIKNASVIASTYATSLWASISVYRIFFHQLRSFPGPFWAKVSKFWHVGKSMSSRNHLFMERLHAQYGDFVRTGEFGEIFLRDTVAFLG